MEAGNDHPFRLELRTRGNLRALDVIGVDANSVYAKMIDGRTIFQYFQLIEPILIERHPYSTRPGNGASNGRAIAGSFDPRRLTESCGYERPLISRPSGIKLPIPGSGLELGTVIQSLDLLDRVGLSYFVDLGLKKPSELTIAGPSTSTSAIKVARQLVEVSAHNFFDLVCEGELIAMGKEADASNQRTDLLNLAQVFTWSVANEFDRRVGAQSKTPGPTISELQKRLDNAPMLPVAFEMVCYWYPGWERSSFLVESALDMAPNYNSLLAALDITPQT